VWGGGGFGGGGGGGGGGVLGGVGGGGVGGVGGGGGCWGVVGFSYTTEGGGFYQPARGKEKLQEFEGTISMQDGSVRCVQILYFVLNGTGNALEHSKGSNIR